jgi:hypothetical protein
MIWLIILAVVNAIVLAFSAKALAHEMDKGNPLAQYVWLLMGMTVLWMATFGIWRIWPS